MFVSALNIEIYDFCQTVDPFFLDRRSTCGKTHINNNMILLNMNNKDKKLLINHIKIDRRSTCM